MIHEISEISQNKLNRIELTAEEIRPSQKNGGFPGGLVVKNPPANAGNAEDAGLIPGSERYPGVGNDTLFQYSCLKNSMDSGAWSAIVHGGHKESDTSDHTDCDHTEENISEIEGPEIDIQNEAQRENTFKRMNRIGCETIPNIKNTYQKEMRREKKKTYLQK